MEQRKMGTYKNKHTGELGEIQSIADGFRFRTEYGFSKWFPNMELLLKEWEKCDE